MYIYYSSIVIKVCTNLILTYTYLSKITSYTENEVRKILFIKCMHVNLFEKKTLQFYPFPLVYFKLWV
jgi:hypothetical protein